MIDNHITRLESEAKKAQDELAKIRRLREEFPDLDSHTDRWKNIRYMAKSANAMVDQIEIRRSCGCCPDTPIIAMPYLEFEGMRLYSDPHYIYIGHQTYNYDVQEEAGWKRQYEQAGISYHVIKKVKEYLKANAPKPEDEDV